MVMQNNLSALEAAYRGLYIFTLVFLAIMLVLCLIRSIRGPKIADRIVAVNMMGTMVMVIIVVLSLLLKEGYLVDICIIYAMISFLSVVVLTKVYMGIYRERKIREEGTGDIGMAAVCCRCFDLAVRSVSIWHRGIWFLSFPLCLKPYALSSNRRYFRNRTVYAGADDFQRLESDLSKDSAGDHISVVCFSCILSSDRPI